jgi:SAM-dependent methyltransferase
MASEIAWNELRTRQQQRVLDQMAGSGTTLVAAKLRGHESVGFDRDPLAVLIARCWTSEVRPGLINGRAREVIQQARALVREMDFRDAYPIGADDETKQFARYWFDSTNRKHLTALSRTIAQTSPRLTRDILWCAFSRLIITKQSGVSLAMDVSHSRPHKAYSRAPQLALERFESSVSRVAHACAFNSAQKLPPTDVRISDARQLPLPDESIDIVITSPPYLNAIDYLRGHKFSLIWMGYTLTRIRDIRRSNVGTEAGARGPVSKATHRVLNGMCAADQLSARHRAMLSQYVDDMRKVVAETRRVLRTSGKAVFVIGDCNLRDVFVRNSRGIELLAQEFDMRATMIKKRVLPDRRRYLPPPSSESAGELLKRRIREEVIIRLRPN